MLLHKKGFPEEGELVLCTVTKLSSHSIFVDLDEYQKQGLIHITEVSPGRIRNIRDFVREGKKVVCLVLRINQERGYIDLSLRRVNESQKRAKIDEVKQEQKAEKIIEMLSHALKKEHKVLYQEIFNKVSKKYESLRSCFEDVVAGKLKLSELGIDKDIEQPLEESIVQRMKPQEVELRGCFTIHSYEPNGVEIIKDAMVRAESENLTLKYEGAGKYLLIVKDVDYKEAERKLKKTVDQALSLLKKNAEAKFDRLEVS